MSHFRLFTTAYSRIAVIVFLLTAAPAHAQKKDPADDTKKDPLIITATVNSESGVIVDLVGLNFAAGDAPPVVTLGGQIMTVDAETLLDTYVSASLDTPPPNQPDAPFPAGDYLLTVVHSKGVGQFDLTVGAVGPRGRQGIQGETGPQGEQGDTGPAGADGTDGQPGADGAAGTSCTVVDQGAVATIACEDGAIASVNDGIDGQAGAPGAAGTSCSVVDDTAGATITCEDGTSASVSDGATGPEGPPGADGTPDTNASTVCGDSEVLLGSGSCVDFSGYLPKTVFVTSTVYDGNLGGLAGANTKCNLRAQAAELPGTYTAWLSTPNPGFNSNAADRVTRTGGLYQRTDGVVVAKGWSDLTDGTLENSINFNEYGQELVTGTVWTGTQSDGTRFDSGDTGRRATCWGWTDDNPTRDITVGGVTTTVLLVGLVGDAAGNDQYWTARHFPPCNRLARLYCFEN